MIRIKQISIADVETLAKLSSETFITAFAHLNNADDVSAYASEAFAVHQLTKEINNPDSAFYFAYLDDEIAGFIKVNYHAAQTEFRDADALEIQRIYIIAKYQNRHLGQQLLSLAEDLAKSKKLRYIWLGVWEHNTGAIRFYERNGFKPFSSHEFMLGNDRQTDLLLKKLLI